MSGMRSGGIGSKSKAISQQGTAAVRFLKGERLLAVATVGRDRESLEAEVKLEASAAR